MELHCKNKSTTASKVQLNFPYFYVKKRDF